MTNQANSRSPLAGLRTGLLRTGDGVKRDSPNWNILNTDYWLLKTRGWRQVPFAGLVLSDPHRRRNEDEGLRETHPLGRNGYCEQQDKK